MRIRMIDDLEFDYVNITREGKVEVFYTPKKWHYEEVEV